MTNEEYSDYALVRDALIETQKRRGFLTYEQKMALQHAEWSASDQRNGYKTELNLDDKLRSAIDVFDDLGSVTNWILASNTNR